MLFRGPKLDLVDDPNHQLILAHQVYLDGRYSRLLIPLLPRDSIQDHPHLKILIILHQLIWEASSTD